jgi:hypothetical protein
MQGFWVWSKLVEALGDLGYDPNMLQAMAFDWRLSIPLLEQRDGYFTRLRASVEVMRALHGEKVVLVCHSFGENVARAFYTWADAQQPGWVEVRRGVTHTSSSALLLHSPPSSSITHLPCPLPSSPPSPLLSSLFSLSLPRSPSRTHSMPSPLLSLSLPHTSPPHSSPAEQDRSRGQSRRHHSWSPKGNHRSAVG